MLPGQLELQPVLLHWQQLEVVVAYEDAQLVVVGLAAERVVAAAVVVVPVVAVELAEDYVEAEDVVADDVGPRVDVALSFVQSPHRLLRFQSIQDLWLQSHL